MEHNSESAQRMVDTCVFARRYNLPPIHTDAIHYNHVPPGEGVSLKTPTLMFSATILWQCPEQRLVTIVQTLHTSKNATKPD